MSSFLAHGLASAALPHMSKDRVDQALRPATVLWTAWLVVVGWGPDIDHVVPALSSGEWSGLRVSHSFAGALILPAITIMFIGIRPPAQPLRRCAEVVAAGMSHVALDFLVGVHPMPLLWPVSDTEVRLSLGILPSAGALELSNMYMWRNLAIEVLILLPILLLLRLRHRSATRIMYLLLLSVAGAALTISVALGR